MNIDFNGVAKKIATGALVAMGTGVAGMIGGGLVKAGISWLDKSGTAEVPATDSEPIDDTNELTAAIDGRSDEIDEPVVEEVEIIEDGA